MHPTHRVVVVREEFSVSALEVGSESLDQSGAPRSGASDGGQRVERLQDDAKSLDPHGPIATQLVLFGHLGNAPGVDQN